MVYGSFSLGQAGSTSIPSVTAHFSLRKKARLGVALARVIDGRQFPVTLPPD
jgi:hypothetical protein